MMSFEEFAAHLQSSAKRVKPALRKTMTEIGMRQVELARSYIGREMEVWPELSEYTIEEKERLGYTGQVSETDPLLREGTLRESIEAVVVSTSSTVVLDVGSNDKIALWQELGTPSADRPIPPRPFLSLSAVENIGFAQLALAKTAAAIILEDE